jgi:hypothetical protein
VLYNQTEVREFHFVVNGKSNSAFKKIQLKANRCAWGICPQETVAKVDISDEKILWSDPKSWPSGKVPVAGDDVHIEPGWNMIYDVEESPILKMVRINGRLSFKNDSSTPLNLRAKHIYVRAGELIIGTKDLPFENKA